MCFTALANNTTYTVLGESSFGNGWRPFRQWLKLERIVATYDVVTANSGVLTVEVYDNGSKVVDEDFERASVTGWRSYDREIDVAIAANNASTPGIVTVKLVNENGSALRDTNILIEGYLVDV